MISGENIICISSIDWDFIWQGHQEVMSSLAKNNRVLFIENTGVRAPGLKDMPRIRNRIRNWLKGIKGIRREMDNLYIYSPLVLPFPYSRIARWINRYLITSTLEKWMKVVDFSDPIIWTFLPTPLSLDLAESFVRKLFIYYCIDNFSASSPSAKKIKRWEKHLIGKVDMVFVTSQELYNYCSMYNSKVYKFPFAVDFLEFEKLRLKDTEMPTELVNIKRPIVGYVGGVHRWIDHALVKSIAEKCPDRSFVFIGPIQTNVSSLSSLKNVYFLGKREHKKLPLFIKYFNIGIIPYLITEYTKNVYPTKLNEYLALGKPVISTALPEVKAFNRESGEIVYVAEDKEDFIELMNKSIDEDSSSLQNRRIDLARQNSWENRIKEMSDLIEREIHRKKIDVEVNWKENLVNFYRLARKKTLRLAVSLFLLYLLMFKTPFIWFLASPLIISEAPEHADAIVVFGGGVGETGSPGKSTIERARYAVKLYNNGYAGKILFSSGYTYNYNDAENMKLFAISMGVPAKDILLEQKANSTYENVIFSKEILDRNGWSSILLVSSPYNMRRAFLVFNKKAKDIEVCYTPIENSQFYDRKYGVKTRQIGAIFHEYLGILYYRINNYI